MYIPRIDDNLKILTDEEVKDFLTICFCKYFKVLQKKKVLEKLLNRFISF